MLRSWIGLLACIFVTLLNQAQESLVVLEKTFILLNEFLHVAFMTIPAGLGAHSVLDESVLSLWDEFAQKAKFLLVDAANLDGKESEPGLILI